jgi:hypothetical protein
MAFVLEQQGALHPVPQAGRGDPLPRHPGQPVEERPHQHGAHDPGQVVGQQPLGGDVPAQHQRAAAQEEQRHRGPGRRSPQQGLPPVRRPRGASSQTRRRRVDHQHHNDRQRPDRIQPPIPIRPLPRHAVPPLSTHQTKTAPSSLAQGGQRLSGAAYRFAPSSPPPLPGRIRRTSPSTRYTTPMTISPTTAAIKYICVRPSLRVVTPSTKR